MRTRTLFPILLVFAACSAAAAGRIDKDRIVDNIHKSFSTPPSMKMTVGELKPSPVRGYLLGELVIENNGRKQEQPILVAEDGSRYILGGLFEVKASAVPGFNELKTFGDGPPAPSILLTQDGRFAVAGAAEELGVDPDEENLSKLRLTRVPSEGPADAPITIVEFSELECPHCRRANASLTKVLKDFPGKIRFIFKNYPLKKIHPWSFDAAIAMACAQKIAPQKAEAFRDEVFEAQPKITEKTFAKDAAGFAEKAGIPKARFTSCFEKKGSRKAVEADIAEGEALEVRGVPSIFVNGRRLRSYQPEEIASVIKEKLGKK